MGEIDPRHDTSSGGRALPRIFVGLTLLGLLLDGALRLGDIDPLTFRAWEAVRLYRNRGVPFEENKKYENPETYGDLSNRANLPELRRIRRQEFTTDARGYRNLPAVADQGKADALLLGTSFSAGNGISDAETLSVRLSELSGKTVYNGAGRTWPALVEIRRLKEELSLSEGSTVIFEHLERNPTPEPGDLSTTAFHRRTTRRLRRPSVLQIALQKSYKSLQNDTIFPNIYRSQVRSGVLSNGETLLFFPQTFQRIEGHRDPERAARFFAWFRDELEKEGLKLLVLLIPNKVTVYGEHITEYDQDPPPDDGYMSRLASAIGAEGIPVVDVTPEFRRLAAEGLDRKEYLYWPDDTHWNARGADTAAREVLKIWNP